MEFIIDKRKTYIVIEDFEEEFPFGQQDIRYRFNKGNIINLLPHKSRTIKLLEKGYIKLREGSND